MTSPEPGLRERTRRAVRAEITTAALDLFLEQGFEETTIEQIAVAAGLSRRSYFRYFSGKDDVFAEVLSAFGQTVAAALADRPPAETPWTALRRSFDTLLTQMAEDDRVQALTRILRESPALAGGNAHKRSFWRASMAAELAPRLGGDEAELRADALAGAALACLDSAEARWGRPENQIPLADLLDLTMGSIHPL